VFYFHKFHIIFESKGANTPGINTNAITSVHIAGSKYKAKPVQAAKQLVQLKGLKSNFHFLWNWCTSTKNIAKHIAAIIIICVIVF
jgi:glucose uptake protein GlcU